MGAVQTVTKELRLAVGPWSHVRVGVGDECWMWWGPLQHPNSGADSYGRANGRQAHRWVYERVVGPIPPGLVLDHLCEVRQCVNPDHLEPVTQSENMRRHAAKRRERAALRQ